MGRRPPAIDRCAHWRDAHPRHVHQLRARDRVASPEAAGNSGVFAWVPMTALDGLPPNQSPRWGIEVQMLDHGYREYHAQRSGGARQLVHHERRHLRRGLVEARAVRAALAGWLTKSSRGRSGAAAPASGITITCAASTARPPLGQREEVSGGGARSRAPASSVSRPKDRLSSFATSVCESSRNGPSLSSFTRGPSPGRDGTCGNAPSFQGAASEQRLETSHLKDERSGRHLWRCRLPRHRAPAQLGHRARPAGQSDLRRCLRWLHQPVRLSLGTPASSGDGASARRTVQHSAAGGAFPQPLPNLPGIPADGGLHTVDLGNHQFTRDNSNGFMFSAGPSRRYVASIESDGIRSVSSLPGGQSGVPGSQFYVNLLRRWLTNDTFPLRTDVVDVPDDRDDDDEDRDDDRHDRDGHRDRDRK